ncbi:hypothetical protein Tco_1478762, partial [Tanacetum coccineum]
MCCYGDDDDWSSNGGSVIVAWCSGGSIRWCSGGLNGDGLNGGDKAVQRWLWWRFTGGSDRCSGGFDKCSERM